MSPTMLMEELRSRLIKPAKPTQPTETPLLDALRKLEIEPLDKEKVEQYKKNKLNETWDKLMFSLKEKGYFRDAASEGYEPGVWNYFNSLSGRVVWDKNKDKSAFLRTDSTRPQAFAMGWHRYSLGAAPGVDSPPPEYVTRKADAIRNEVPTATLEQDQLESQSVVYDPLLVVRSKSGDEEYYVEIWGADEHEFSR